MTHSRLAVMHAAISDYIRDVGWAVQGIGHQTIPWAYTIGLSDRGHPELIVTGMDLHAGGTLLNLIGACVKRGLDVSNPSVLARALKHDLVVLSLRPVDPTWKATHLLDMAHSYYGSVPETAQVVIADAEGRFLWDAGHQLGIEQPHLWKAWPGGWPDDDAATPGR